MPRIIALSGSPTTASLNHSLLLHALTLIDEPVELIRVAELELPLYSGDLEAAHGVPERAKALGAAIDAADGLIIASPEYNSSMPAMLKNTIDWISRANGMGFFRGAKVLLMGTSQGKRGGKSNLAHLEQVVPYWGGEFIASFSLPEFDAHMTDGVLVTEAYQTELAGAVERFIHALDAS